MNIAAVDSQRSDERRSPERAGRVFQDLGVNLLPAQPRAFVWLDDLSLEHFVDVGTILVA